MPEAILGAEVSPAAAASYFDEYYVSLTEAATRGTACAQQVDFLLQTVATAKGAALLDVCCGHGRHLRALEQEGYTKLAGIDISTYSINVARQALSPTVALTCGNVLTSLPGGLLEGIYCLESSWACFTPVESVRLLNALRSRLRPGGRLVLHVFNPTYVMQQLPASLLTSTPQLHMAEQRHYNLPERLLTIHQQHTLQADDGSLKRAEKAISLVMYTAGDLTQLLHEQGFVVEQLVGDFYGGLFDETSSPDIILVGSLPC